MTCAEDAKIVKAVLGELDGVSSHDWEATTVAVTREELTGADLKDRLKAQTIRKGWIVRTDSVLVWKDNDWHCRRGKREDQEENDPFHRLLQAEFALEAGSGLRLELLEGETWMVETVTEGAGGADCLAATVTHMDIEGDPSLTYRVYWQAPEGAPYRQVAARLAPEYRKGAGS